MRAEKTKRYISIDRDCVSEQNPYTHKPNEMQRIIVADSAQFQAELQKKLDKLKQDIISELSNSINSKKDQQTYLTRHEVTQKYRISLVTLHMLTVRMKLNSIKVGKRRIYEASELERFFREAK